MADELLSVLSGLTRGFAMRKDRDQKLELQKLQLKALQSKIKAQETEQEMKSSLMAQLFGGGGGAPGVVSADVGEGQQSFDQGQAPQGFVDQAVEAQQGGGFRERIQDPKLLTAAKFAGFPLTDIGSLATRQDRNVQLHEESMQRIDESRRRNDIAEATYNRGNLEWTPIKGKDADGREITTFVPKFLGPGGPVSLQTRPGSGAIKPPQLPTAVRGEVATLQTLVDELNFIKENVKQNYTGLPGFKSKAKLQVAGFVPQFDLSDPDYAVWSMKFEGLKAIERHEKFGAAFTSTEKAAFKKMFPSEVRKMEDFLAQVQATIDFTEKKKSNILEAQTGTRETLLNSVKARPDVKTMTDAELLREIQEHAVQ